MASERKYDIVVFGATGFTGQYTVDEMARVSEEEQLTWAVAGRNMSKIQTVLAESSKRIGKNVEEIPIIIADTSSYQSLLEMAQQCKVVLNCVGPYQYYGEDVVKACIEGGANHFDISGEPQFLEKMQLLYNAKAKESNVLIIGSAGFDSIPTEMGLLYSRKQFNGEVTNIESYLTIQEGSKGISFNTGTFESLVQIFANRKEMRNIRASLFEPLPEYEYQLPKRYPVFYSKDVNKWSLSIMPEEETSVGRTMRDLISTKRLEKPFEFQPYMCRDSLLQAMVSILMMIIVGIMAQVSIGRSLLMKFPHIFTFGMFRKGGPSKEQIETTAFSMVFVAQGYKESVKERSDKKPDKVIKTKVVGPEPAYVTTPICMVQCAVTLLKEHDKLFHQAGVYSPGAVFEDTSLIERLEKHNVKFSTVEE